jgi:hypothetical protein
MVNMDDWKSLINLDTVTSFKAVEGKLTITTYEKSLQIIPKTTDERDTYDELLSHYFGNTEVNIISDMMRFENSSFKIRNFDSYLLRRILLTLIEANLDWIYKISNEESEEIIIQSKFEFNKFTAHISINNDLLILLIEIVKVENP